ncbi:small subunit ribosomal protein S17 [Corynebacterium mycetoides]|uniref:Small ribosomal subunit protein uS17 n=1 Tax=Corynebacterium mycetoides TaxID=38302 RepID=A0A1G9QFN1_9CORY|nr:30S ribosomal protein S17 [Corynebacterium mycetoides]SDM09793.1 small subunit ribosomal protein S17 [Corynebacterium mycetoides]
MTEATEVNVTESTAPAPKEKSVQKRRRGYVVSDKMDKTIVVEVEDRKSHSLYGKIVRSTKRVKAHDEDNTAGVGDLVLIEETRPLSKDKHFRLVEIVEKAR